MINSSRPLDGFTVGISISDSTESVALGFPSWQVNHVVIQIVTALIGQGAAVVFGHDWREDGVMEAVHGFACRMQTLGSVTSRDDIQTRRPLLQNLLAWPDVPQLGEEELRRFGATLLVEQCGLPQDLVDYDTELRAAPLNSDDYRYARARALTHMRRRLNERCNARLCIGGQVSGYQGRYPGIVEEALLSVQERRPIYLAGVLGGAAKQVADAINGSVMPSDFCAPTALAQLYTTRRQSGEHLRQSTERDVEVRPERAWSTFRGLELSGLAGTNHLGEDENRALFSSSAVAEVIQLLLQGLARLHARA